MDDYGDLVMEDYTAISASSGGIGSLPVALLAVYSVAGVAVCILMLICLWMVFKKAGRKGWEAIVPIYNIVVFLNIAECPVWYIFLFMIPIVGIIFMFKTYIKLAHNFGKSTGFGVGFGLLGIVFLPILAFGKATYKNGNGGNIIGEGFVKSNEPVIGANEFNHAVDNNVDAQPVSPVMPINESAPSPVVNTVSPVSEVTPVAPVTPVVSVNDVTPVTPVTPVGDVTPVSPVNTISEPTPINPVNVVPVQDSTLVNTIVANRDNVSSIPNSAPVSGIPNIAPVMPSGDNSNNTNI